MGGACGCHSGTPIISGSLSKHLLMPSKYIMIVESWEYIFRDWCLKSNWLDFKFLLFGGVFLTALKLNNIKLDIFCFSFAHHNDGSYLIKAISSWHTLLLRPRKIAACTYMAKEWNMSHIDTSCIVKEAISPEHLCPSDNLEKVSLLRSEMMAFCL